MHDRGDSDIADCMRTSEPDKQERCKHGPDLRRDRCGPHIPKVVPASRQTRECTVNQAHEIEFDVSYLKKARQTEHQKSPVSVPTAAGSLPAWCRTHHQHELTLTDQPALFHPFVL